MNKISARAGRVGTAPLVRCCGAAQANEIDRLYAALDTITPATNPRTAKLLQSGSRRLAQKVIEEAGEVAIDAVRRGSSGVIRESADLLYHLVVLWRHAGVAPHQVWEEMKARAERLGIAEKLPKGRASNGATSQAES